MKTLKWNQKRVLERGKFDHYIERILQENICDKAAVQKCASNINKYLCKSK